MLNTLSPYREDEKEFCQISVEKKNHFFKSNQKKNKGIFSPFLAFEIFGSISNVVMLKNEEKKASQSDSF